MLHEIRVCTVPGDNCGSALRISYSTSLDKIEEAFNRIIPWMKMQDFG